MLIFYLSLIEDHDRDQIMIYIYEHYQERMIAYAESILHHYQDAENAVQEAFIGIAKRINTIENPESIKCEQYVYTVVRNAARRYYQSNRKHQNTEYFDDIRADIPNLDTVSCNFEDQETYRSLVALIKKMDPIYRDVLSLYYLYDHSPRQIADLLKRPVATVRSQLQRGTEKIKEVFQKGNLR